MFCNITATNNGASETGNAFAEFIIVRTFHNKRAKFAKQVVTQIAVSHAKIAALSVGRSKGFASRIDNEINAIDSAADAGAVILNVIKISFCACSNVCER